MSHAVQVKRASVERKKRRIRKHINGTAERPRLSVYRSERHIYAQVINDERGATLVSMSTQAKDLRDTLKGQRPLNAAKLVGEALAEKAQAAGITQVVFDRNGRRYAGRVAALADGARSKGLQF